MENVARKMTDDSTTALTGKNLVVGLGKTGLSVVRFLARKGLQVAVNDSRDVPPGLNELKSEFPDVARFTGGFNELAFKSANRLIVNPGISIREPAIAAAQADGVEVIGDIELFARFVDKPVIAITGSNGKTTVTTLVGEMARQAGIAVGVGGNIGTPALDLLDQGNELYVLELSSFQLETLYSLKPQAAVVLNVTEDHMDRYDNLQDYAAAKQAVYKGAQFAVINLDDETVVRMKTEGVRVGYTLSGNCQEGVFNLCEKNGQRYLSRGNEKLLPVDELMMPGRHNQSNALAALALGEAVGIPMQAMLNTLRSFSGLPHRTQYVGEVNQVRFYNDSKATNVGASIAALSGFDDGLHKSVVILGGDCKQADFSALTNIVSQCCRGVVLMGRDAPEILEHLPKAMPLEHAVNIKHAVDLSLKLAEPGDRVLLSPACASFDMFNGFEDRGNQFMLAVRELTA